MKRIIGLIFIFIVVVASSAMAGQKNGGLAASYAKPEGAFANLVDDGYGISAIFDYPMAGTINISGSIGWYRFGGLTIIEGTNVKLESSTMWEFSAGPQIDFGKLYIGVEGGYFTELNEWGAVANAGVRRDMLDLGVRYKMTEDGKFMAVRLGFFF